MIKKASLFALIAIIIAQSALAAINIEITPKEAAFSAGESLSFSYRINSDAPINIVYLPYIKCPTAPVAILEKRTASLNNGTALQGEYRGAAVDEAAEPQTCTAGITILAPETKKVEQRIRIAANPSFDFALMACADSSCTKQKSAFAKGSRVYLKAVSRAAPSVSSIISYPGGKTETISVPGSFAATEPGEYSIAYSATKKGFKEFSSTASIFIIEKAYTVPYAEFSSKAGQVVVRPAYKEPLRTMNAAKTPAETKAPAKKASFRRLISRVTGYFALIYSTK